MPRVLVVEDDESLRKCLELCLAKDGWEARGAPSVEQAVLCLQEEPFDLVVTDYLLSTEKTGLSLLALLGRNPSSPPAILISGSRNIGLQAAASELGAYAFLQKAFALDDFLDICRRALRRGPTRYLPCCHAQPVAGR